MDETTSSELFKRACAVIPGGVNSPVRAFTAVDGEPLFGTHELTGKLVNRDIMREKRRYFVQAQQQIREDLGKGVGSAHEQQEDEHQHQPLERRAGEQAGEVEGEGRLRRRGRRADEATELDQRGREGEGARRGPAHHRAQQDAQQDRARHAARAQPPPR